jgi:hypothetical protein
MADWRDRYDHVPKSNGTFCKRCGRFCKRKTAIGYRQKDMYVIYTIHATLSGQLYWDRCGVVCPECKDILEKMADKYKMFRKITDYTPLPVIYVRPKCKVG